MLPQILPLEMSLPPFRPLFCDRIFEIQINRNSTWLFSSKPTPLRTQLFLPSLLTFLGEFQMVSLALFYLLSLNGFRTKYSMKIGFFKVTNIFSPVKNRNFQDC